MLSHPTRHIPPHTCFVKDNETAIHRIMKGRSPHVPLASSTKRDHLDWFFAPMNLDPSSSVRHVNTNQQIANILVKSSFTRDNWIELLDLFGTLSDRDTHFRNI